MQIYWIILQSMENNLLEEIGERKWVEDLQNQAQSWQLSLIFCRKLKQPLFFSFSLYSLKRLWRLECLWYWLLLVVLEDEDSIGVYSHIWMRMLVITMRPHLNGSQMAFFHFTKFPKQPKIPQKLSQILLALSLTSPTLWTIGTPSLCLEKNSGPLVFRLTVSWRKHD